jgi:hypothetical protein
MGRDRGVFDTTAGMTNQWIGSRPTRYRQQQLHPSRIIIEILEVSRVSHIINVPPVAGNNSSAQLARAPSETLAAKKSKTTLNIGRRKFIILTFSTNSAPSAHQ